MINLAVIGLGIWGQRHVRSAKASGRFNVVTAVNPENSRVASIAKELGLTLTPSFEDVLLDGTVNAVSLATPHTLHSKQIIKAAEAGKHIYVEKPFALNAYDARRAISAIEAADVVIALGHDQRHYPVIKKLKELITEETFGKVLHIETNLSHDSVKLLYEKNRQFGESSTQRAWRLLDSEAPAGPISQFGIHRVDAFIGLIGEIDWVFAAGSCEALDPSLLDSISVMLGFKCGTIGHLGNSLATPLCSRMKILGTSKWAECSGPETFEEYRECSLTNLTVYTEGDPEDYTFEIVDSVAENFSSFADAIEGIAPFTIPAKEMVHNIAVVDAICESIEKKKRVSVKSI